MPRFLVRSHHHFGRPIITSPTALIPSILYLENSSRPSRASSPVPRLGTTLRYSSWMWTPYSCRRASHWPTISRKMSVWLSCRCCQCSIPAARGIEYCKAPFSAAWSFWIKPRKRSTCVRNSSDSSEISACAFRTRKMCSFSFCQERGVWEGGERALEESNHDNTRKKKVISDEKFN